MTGAAVTPWRHYGRLAAETMAFWVLYVALDRISFIHQLEPLNITPWNPPSGLALALLLLRGPNWACLGQVASAVVLADFLVRGLPASLALSVMSGLVIAGVYGGAAHLLLRWGKGLRDLGSLRDVFCLLAVAAVASATVAVLYVGQFTVAGVVPVDELVAGISRYWVGDMIGIVVMTPLILVHRRRRPVLSPWGMAEALAQALALGGALWLVFSGHDGQGGVTLFYLLFLPLIWIGARFGLEGATLGNQAAQIGLIAALEVVGREASVVTAFQTLMLTLATATLILGAAITDRRRVQSLLHARQEEMAGNTRLSMAGEIAGAMAHELNQPLLAAIAFTRASQRFLAADVPDPAKAAHAMDRAVAETQRAGDIIRSLREFFGQGRGSRAPQSVAQLVADAAGLAAPECARRDIRLNTWVDKSLPAIHVDKVQIQQVLQNLLRNAMDAMADGGTVTLSARLRGSWVEVEVSDTGSGIADEVAARLFEPFNTSKATGMGLGLAIARGFAESHGGQLWLDRSGPGGSSFRFTMPVAGQGGR